jgi:hypothetical protein
MASEVLTPVQDLSFISPVRFASLLEENLASRQAEVEFQYLRDLDLRRRFYRAVTGFERHTRTRYSLNVDWQDPSKPTTLFRALFNLSGEQRIGTAIVSTASEVGPVDLDDPNEWLEELILRTNQPIELEQGILPPAFFNVRVYGPTVGGKPRVDFASSQAGIFGRQTRIALPNFAPNADWFLSDQVLQSGYDS